MSAARLPEHDMKRDAAVDLGWGRIVFGQTFDDWRDLAALLRTEELGQRDICVYHPSPHVLVSRAPYELFLDPSHVYRRWLVYEDLAGCAPGVRVRRMARDDVEDVNRIYAQVGMVTAPADVLEANCDDPALVYFVAEDESTGEVVGTVTSIDHVAAFGDPEQGSSLWSLAVDPTTARGGVGESLTRAVLAEMDERGRQYVDLSVMHDNIPAIRLYEKLGFERLPVLCVKRKNPINVELYAPGNEQFERLNPYARIIADEARRRGIHVEVLDAEGGFLRLEHAGRSIVTRESLSELTSAVSMSWCDDKRVTRRLLSRAGLRVPRGVTARGGDADAVFLAEVGDVVVKPARGEQGRGITVGVRDADELAAAVERARELCPEVLLEERCGGDDLRIVVIDHEVVAAAVRRPATVTGDGTLTVRELIENQSRRREAATGGESSIPVDEITEATVAEAGRSMDDVLPAGDELTVRRTANLHTGGTIHDVTDRLHPDLVDAAVQASRVLRLPVTGIDLLVPDVEGPDYVFIEANERPGLANHEPRPTAERFVDLLFPSTSAVPRRWTPR
jgi:GNAT-family acetyltransferase (TIGR03103 family)